MKWLIFIVLIGGVVALILLQDPYGCPDEGRDDCLLAVAAEEEDKQICTEIDSETKKDDCYYMFVKEMGGEKSTCESITDQNKRDNCYMLFATEERTEPDVCRLIESDNSKDKCHFFMAKKFNNLSECNNILESPLKTECLNHIAATNNSQACAYFNTTIQRDNCYYSLADSNNESGLCFDIQDREKKNDCIFEFAQKTEVALCSELTGTKTPYTADYCYLEKAMSEEDAAFCNNITNKKKQDLCIMAIRSG